MASVDERVVAMSFENAKFESGVSVTMATLAKLDATLANIGKNNGLADIEKVANKVTLAGPMSALDRLRSRLFGAGAGAAEGFSQIQRESGRVTLQPIASAVDSIQTRFSGMTVIFAAALGTMVATATAKAQEIVKALSLGPITGGLEEYATNLNSIQTILANTQVSGAGLKEVNASLKELNHYSDQTIYNFSEMAKNIGTFTAAGVDLETATGSIKGIANLAALSGSNSQQAATAMYQLSQAIAAGRVSLQDWNSVVNAGMGGTVFQRALAQTAQAMGTLSEGAVQLKGKMKNVTIEGQSFRESINATAKRAKSSTSEVRDAQMEAAEAVARAQESAAESVTNANERVEDAQKGVVEAAQQTAKAVADASESVKDAEEGVAEAARQSAESIKIAKREVEEAEAGVAEATKQSTRDVKAAQKEQRQATVDSADAIKSALDTVREARKRLAEAMKPPSADELEAASDRLTTAQLDQADLADAVTEAQREQVRAAEDLAAAEERLQELRSSGASPEEIASAQRTLEDAQKRVADAADAVTRAEIRQRDAARNVNSAQADLTETQKKGTKEDKNRKDSQDALTRALKQYRQATKDARDAAVKAERDVTKARRDGAKAQEEAAERLVAAEQKVAETRRSNAESQQDAADRLIEAERSVAEARQEGAEREAEASEAVIEAQRDQAKATREAQKQVAEAHEQAAESVSKARDSMSKSANPSSWLTSDVLTTTLQQFTGDLSKAELKAKGFTDEQIKAIQKTAETAKKAATEVKTLKGVFDVAKESMGSGWAATFQLIFGNFKEAKGTFTDLSNSIGGVISRSAEARNAILKDWKELGGREELIKGIKAAWEALSSVLTPIKEAFRDIFPRKTGQDLYDLTVRFREFMEALKIGPETAENLKRTFRGFFALLNIGKTIIFGIIGVIFDLLGVVGDGSGGFLAFTGSIGDFIVALDKAISKGEGLEGLFEGLEAVLRVPLELLKAIAGAIAGLFGDADPATGKEITKTFDEMSESLGPMGAALEAVIKVWKKFFDVAKDIANFLQPILEDIVDVFSAIGDAVVEGLEGIDYDKVMTAIQTTFLGGLALGVKKLLGGIGLDVTGGMVDNFKQVTETLSGTLVAIQRNVNARTMLLIAAAVLALAGATILFSQVDPKKLGKAMLAISVGIGQLVGAMALLTKVGGHTAFLTLPFAAAGILLLAGALVVLGAAVHIFARLSWEDLAKGLLGVAGGLAIVATATKFMGPGLLVIGPGLIAVAIAMNLLAVAMKIIGSMDWDDLVKGILGIAGALVAVGLAVTTMGPSLLLVGPGLILASTGLILLSGAISSFGNMDLLTMGKGLLGVAAALVVVGAAMTAIPITIAIQAAGLLILGVALTALAAAVGAMGSLKIPTLVKGLIGIAGALGILAIGLTAMAGTLPGSLALLAAAAAFAILAPALGLMGSLKWGTIAKGLAAIALTLGVLAGVGALAAGPLTALGVALLVIGGSVVLVGAGLYLMAKAFTLLGEEGTKGVSVMIAAITAFIALIPSMVINFVKGVVAILESLTELAPKIAENIVKIVGTFLAALVDLQPEAATLIGALLETIVQVLNEHSGPVIDAGWNLLVNFLSGISNNIGKVTESVIGIITGFLNAVTANAGRLVSSGVSALAAWLKGIADNIGRVVASALNVVVKFLGEITENLPKVYAAGVRLIVTFLRSIAEAIPKVIAAGVRIIVSVLEGIGDAIPRIIAAGVRVISKFMDGIASAVPRLVDAGFKAVIKLLNGIAKAIRDNDDDLIAAGWNIADAIGEGLLKGLASIGPKVKDALGDMISDLPSKALDILGISSPSKVFTKIGEQTMDGMTKGILQGGVESTRTMGKVTDDVIKTASDAFSKVPDVLGDMADMDPVITPVLDLSKVERDAKKLGDLTNVTPITAAASYTQATAISEEHEASQVAQAEATGSSVEINYEQNNYSPEALDDVEIYRKTGNQLAQIKGVVGLVAELP